MAPLSYLSNGLSVPQTTLLASEVNNPFDYFIFIDGDDGAKIKAISGRTMNIFSTHATNADVVINACLSNLMNGGTILMGPGTFNYYNVLNWGGHSVNLIGSGRGKTTLVRQYTTNAQAITVTADNVTMAHLTIDGNATAITCSFAEMAFSGINNLAYDVEMKNWAGTGGITNRNVLTIDSCVITGPNPPINSPTKGQYCILNYNSTRNIIKNCNLQYGNLNAIFTSGQTLIQNCYMANCGVPAGGHIGNLGQSAIEHTVVDSCYFGKGLGADSGVEIANASYIVTNNIINGCSAWGIAVEGLNNPVANKWVIVRGNIVKNVGQMGIGYGLNPANTPYQYVIIEDNICFDDQATPTQQYGIYVYNMASNNYIIRNNICYNNKNGQFFDGGTGTSKIVTGNIGYNPVAAATITPAASGTSPTYQNTHGYPEVVAIFTNAGSISSIVVTRGSTNVTLGITSGEVILQNNDSVTVTYVSPITMMRYPM